eukprot:scaffold24_cov128-Cylindrotheca_fusiformis.AAC.9
MQQQPAVAGAGALVPGQPQLPGVPLQPSVSPPQPANLANSLGVQIGHTTYAEYYDDPSKDLWKGEYGQLYQLYDSLPTQDLRDRLYSSGNNLTAVSVLLHIREANAKVNDPGKIVVYHRLTRVEDNIFMVPPAFPHEFGHGFLGDVLRHGQAPYSVELPDAVFERIGQSTQVPDHELMEQLLNADPNLELIEPQAAGTPGCSSIGSRQAMIVPNYITRLFLHQEMTPRVAYQTVHGVLQVKGHVTDCKPLLDWLRLALTRPAANEPPRTTVLPLRPPILATPTEVIAFQKYRLVHLHYDVPGILVPEPALQMAYICQQGVEVLRHEQELTKQAMKRWLSDE